MSAICPVSETVVVFPTMRRRRYATARINHNAPPEGVVSLYAIVRREAEEKRRRRSEIMPTRTPELVLILALVDALQNPPQEAGSTLFGRMLDRIPRLDNDAHDAAWNLLKRLTPDHRTRI